jgi:hypothetical protein
VQQEHRHITTSATVSYTPSRTYCTATAAAFANRRHKPVLPIASWFAESVISE